MSIAEVAKHPLPEAFSFMLLFEVAGFDVSSLDGQVDQGLNDLLLNLFQLRYSP